MHLSAPFIQRPVATSLLSLALLLAGSVAYSVLPVASLPNVDYPVIGVGAGLPGASPETMASSVATPLERQFGRIAGVNQMTSSSSLGSASSHCNSTSIATSTPPPATCRPQSTRRAASCRLICRRIPAIARPIPPKRRF
jgi:hypothetical protein